MNRYPVAFSVILLPITCARLSEFAGHHVPFSATISTAFIYNLNGMTVLDCNFIVLHLLQGFVNVILLLSTKRLFPEMNYLPEFSTKRKYISMSVSKSNGITPFTLERSDTAEKYLHDRTIQAPSRAHSVASQISQTSRGSAESLAYHPRWNERF
jgi:hypothetical protein